MKERNPTTVQRAARGDREAFATLVEEHWTPLVRVARSVVGDADAEDAVQDALVIAWRKIGGVREHDAVGAWLRRVVVRSCLRRMRRLRFWLPLDDAPEPYFESDPESAIDLGKCLSLLAPRQRAALHLTVVEGMSDREIAETMGITAASVRSHRRRARERLDQLLQGDER